MTSTTLLFLPYDNKKKPFDNDNVQSRQQHTALEYHRKRKLSKSQSRSSMSRTNESPTPQSLGYSPGTSTSGDSETTDATELSHPRVIGKWRLDPFDALRDTHVPEYVQEMLDHGKPIRNIYQTHLFDIANLPYSHKTSMGALRSFAGGRKTHTS